METAGEGERPSVGRLRSRRGVWVLLMLLIVLLVGAVGLALQPHRKTFVSAPVSAWSWINPKDQRKFPERFVLEYPDNWQLIVTPGDTGASLVLKRASPGGLVGWWHQHIQHENATLWEQDELSVEMYPLKEGQDIDTFEREIRTDAALKSYPLSCYRIRHPLGPALDATFVYRQPARQGHTVWIYPQDTPAHRKIVVEITSTCFPAHASQRDSALSVLLEHLRLVDEK